MIPSTRIALVASFALWFVAPTAVRAQPARADLPASWHTTTRADNAESWKTTIDVAPVPRSKLGKPIATGALPTRTPVLPKGSVAGTTHTLTGIASFYWQDQKTASGERFDKMAMTAAHKTLPFGTRVRVTNVGSGQSVVVRINDRGPFKAGRVVDLSYAAAGVIGMRDKGLTAVKLEVVN